MTGESSLERRRRWLERVGSEQILDQLVATYIAANSPERAARAREAGELLVAESDPEAAELLVEAYAVDRLAALRIAAWQIGERAGVNPARLIDLRLDVIEAEGTLAELLVDLAELEHRRAAEELAELCREPYTADQLAAARLRAESALAALVAAELNSDRAWSEADLELARRDSCDVDRLEAEAALAALVAAELLVDLRRPARPTTREESRE